MEIKRAIAWQKAFKRTYKHTPEDVDEACDMVISAIEKQSSKKPQFYATNFYCPCCKNLVGNSDFGWKHNYCERCGQAIDWSDDN